MIKVANFTYKKPDQPEEKKCVLVLKSGENMFGGIDLNRVTAEKKEALIAAADLINEAEKSGVYRTYKNDRITGVIE